MRPEPTRFLVTLQEADADKLESMAKRARVSRNHYVVLAILEKLKSEPAGCPICGKIEDHAH